MELVLSTKKVGATVAAVILLAIYLIWILNVQQVVAQTKAELEQQLIITQQRKEALSQRQEQLLAEQEQLRLAIVNRDLQQEQELTQQIAKLQGRSIDTSTLKTDAKAQEAKLQAAALLEQQRQAAILEAQRQAELQAKLQQRKVTRAS